MLKKINRLQKSTDFSKVFRFGKSIGVNRINLKIAASPSFKTARFGYVISNKIDKRATRRNALKRRFRSATRELMPDMTGNFSAIIVVKQNYPYPYSYTEIKSDLTKALTQAGVLKK